MGSKQLPIKWVPGLERPGLEVNYSYHLLPRLGISGATPLILPLCLHGVDRDFFFFFFENR